MNPTQTLTLRPKRIWAAGGLIAALVLCSCDGGRGADASENAVAPVAQAASKAQGKAPRGVDAQAGHVTQVGGCAPVDALAQLDHRSPVHLQPMMAWHQKQNMMEHLVAIQQITDGLAREDWDTVARAASLIQSSPQMQQMCEHMGAGAEGFTELALEFHQRADKIGEAAKAQDSAATLHATSSTLLACTSCHAAYRQDIVDAETWQARTGSALPAGGHMGH